jgi:hypothetical protein
MSDGYTLSEEELNKRLEQRTAPHVNIEGIMGRVTEVTFYKHKLSTICVIELWNGFNVIGHSAAAHADNYNEDIGRHYAFLDAVRQIWPLEGYRLKTNLANESEPEGK